MFCAYSICIRIKLLISSLRTNDIKPHFLGEKEKPSTQQAAMLYLKGGFF